jgi:hypothetical protein
VPSYVVRTLGDQTLAVAIPYQVYRLTGSTLDVGLVSLAQLGGRFVIEDKEEVPLLPTAPRLATRCRRRHMPGQH